MELRPGTEDSEGDPGVQRHQLHGAGCHPGGDCDDDDDDNDNDDDDDTPAVPQHPDPGHRPARQGPAHLL